MYVRVHAVPKAKREQVIRIDAALYEIHVREPAERNRANNRIKELLAEAFGLTPGRIRMLTGHHSSSKMFSIDTTS